MPVIIPPLFAQATFNWTSDRFAKGKAATVIGVLNGTQDLGATAVDLVGIAGAHIIPEMSVEITLESVVVITPQERAEVVSGLSGDQSGAPLTVNSTALIRKVTQGRGRSNQGRIYWPGLLIEADVDSAGYILPTRLGNLQDAFEAWFEAMVDQDHPICVLHSNSSDPTQVQALSVQPQIATQRRRMRR